MQDRKMLTISLCSLAVISGAFGLSVTGVFDNDDKPIISSIVKNGGMMMGHAVIEAYDSQGNLKAFRETDNEVVDKGEQCVLKMFFGASGPAAAGTTVCTGGTTGAWNVIAIGTNSSSANDHNTGLHAEEDGDLARGVATTQTWTNGTGATTTKIQLSKTFTSDSTTTITESGLFNSTTTSTGGMLARQTFSGVALSIGDSITVTWTFTVGD